MAKIIGITGGVGAGKSAVLCYLSQAYGYSVIQADQVAHEVKEKGTPCYEALVELLGEDILDGEGQINRCKMADVIFKEPDKLRQVNELIHPAVQEVLLQAMAEEDGAYLFIEAALLIESGYLPYLDELWYIYADEEVRRKRLEQDRGYSIHKTDDIFASQLTDEEYRSYKPVVIDNSQARENAFHQIDKILEGCYEAER
ncbi:MAG: dephospho-CoA kinase [Eubacteriales bacterium]